MPSGSKKRKALKKPKPGEPSSSQGDPPELEPGFIEEAMANDGDEMLEDPPSPKVMGRASEGVPEVGVEELIDEAPRKEQVAEAEDASASHHSEAYPPLQREQESKVATIEAHDESAVEGEITPTPDISGGESPIQIEPEKNMPICETVPDSTPPPGRIEPAEVEPYVELTGLDQDKDGGAGPPPVDITSEMNEDEPTKSEMVGSQAGLDEPPVELERVSAISPEDTGPKNGPTPDDVAALGIDPEAHEALIAMQSGMDAPPGDAQPENDEEAAAREPDIVEASAIIRPEGTDVTPVETIAETDDGPASVQLEVDDTVVEMQPEADTAAETPGMVAAPEDAQSKTDQDPVVGEIEADTPSAKIEPEAAIDIAESIECPPDVQLEMEEATEQRQLQTDAIPSNFEPEIAEGEMEKDQEGEVVAPKLDSPMDMSEGEIKPITDVTSVDVEPGPGMSITEAESATDASPDKIEPEAAAMDDTEKDEMADAETKPKVNSAPIDTEQHEEAQEKCTTSIEVEPEVEPEKAHTSLEAEADASIESEPGRLGEASENINSVTGPTARELEGTEGMVEPGTEALPESSEVSCSSEGVKTSVEAETEPKEVTIEEGALVHDTEPVLTEASKENLNGGVENPLETDTELVRETTCVVEPEADSEVQEPEPDVEVLPESKSDQEGSNEAESGQQDLFKAEPDEPRRETNSCVGGSEFPANEANQEESLVAATISEASSIDGLASSAPEGEAPAVADASVPANQEEALEEADIVSPSTEVLKDETDARDTGVGLDPEGNATDDQPLEPNECVLQQETADVDDVLDHEKASIGEVHEGAVPREEDWEIEQRSAISVDEAMAHGEEPYTAVTESSQPTFDKQDLAMNPSNTDAPSGESEIVEQGLDFSSLPESEVVAFEQGGTFDSPSENVEEEETALSTMAEAGSAANDFGKSTSYQQLLTKFPSSGQDAETPESRDYDDDRLLPRAPELTGAQEDDKVSLTAGGDSQRDEVEWKSVQDSELATENEEVSPESANAENLVTNAFESLIGEPVTVCSSEESNAPDKDTTVVEVGRGGDEDGQGTVLPISGIVPALESLAVAEDVMPTVLPIDKDGLPRLPSSETPRHDPLSTVEGAGNQDNDAVEPEIYSSDGKDSKAVASAPSGEALMNTSNESSPHSASLGRDIADVQGFQKTLDASVPVVFPTENVKQRALEERIPKDRGGTLQRRTNWLGCCGMFDLLLGKNK